MKVKKFLKGFMAVALAVTMMVTPVSLVMCNSLTVFAAPETMPDGTVFDAEYYAQTYPDVANAVGTDRDALYNHYVTFGKAKGRMACAPTTTVQADKTPTEPSAQSKDPLTARTTPTQALVYANILPNFMLTDSRPTSGAGGMYVYDAYGNLINPSVSPRVCICDAEGRIVACQVNSTSDLDLVGNCFYNEQGQLTQIGYWDYEFYYDDLGRLIKIIRELQYREDELLYEYSYDEQGRTVYRYYGGSESGVVEEYNYDEQGRLVRTSYYDHGWNDGRYVIYVYDASGKLTRWESAYKSPSQSKYVSNGVTEFSYN